MEQSMSNPHSAFDTPAGHRPSRLSMHSGLLAPVVALVVALQCAPLWADEVDDAARFNATSAPQAEISWMSGGIGDEAREEMRKAARAYNVHIVFSARNGDYLATVPVTVTRRNGQKIYSGVSDGPLLYLKLPPGSYQLAAEIDGAWQSKRIEAGASGRATKVTFVSRGE
ncbi:hypothetical protein [Aromatoleum diolicum]|nr:hypothetical protein [Aromatoleum diolicum]